MARRFVPGDDPAVDALRRAFSTPVTPAVMATVVDDCHMRGRGHARAAADEPDDPDSSTGACAATLAAAHRHATALEQESDEGDEALASRPVVI